MPIPVETTTDPAGKLAVYEIATRVKRQFGDEFGAQITDEDILRWINDAMRDICLNNNLLEKKSTTAVVANQQDYSIPNDLLTLHTVRYGTLKLSAFSLQEADEFISQESANTGDPLYYSLWANTLSLYPIPTTAATSLTLFYTRTPLAVTSLADTPEIPAAYHLRLVEYCIAQAHELDADQEAYQRKMAQFKENVQSTKDNGEWDSRDFYPNISASIDDTEAYGIGYYG